MPTDLFFKLAIEKQEKILSAAKKEFSQCSYFDASINHIIKGAGISRGSFYDYFANKEDLFFYIFKKDIKEPLTKEYMEKFKGQPVDLFEMGLYFFDIVSEAVANEEDFLINICTTTNIKQLSHFLKMKQNDECSENTKESDIEKIEEYIKLGKLDYANVNELFFIFDIVKLTVLSSILSMLTENRSAEMTRETLIANFQSLKHGFEK